MSDAYVKGLQQLFQSNSDLQTAIPMKKYMKDKFEFLGIKSPLRKELLGPFMSAKGWPEGDELRTVATALWALPEREYQYAALDMLVRKAKSLRKEDIGFIEALVTERSWWDTVDIIAGHLVGALFANYPELIRPYTDKWLASGNMWLQRTAILFQLKYKKRTDVTLLFHCIEACSASSEFFLRKAIGWALREYAKTDCDAVRAFVDTHPLSPLSRREALKGREVRAVEEAKA